MSIEGPHVAAGDMPMPHSDDPSPATPPAPGGLPGIEPPTLNVTIRLDDLLWDPERGVDLTGRIAQEAAEQLLSGMRAEVLAQARAEVTSVLRTKLEDIIETMLTQAIEQAIQGTDSYGNPKGEPTTLHEVIVKRADKVLRERRDRSVSYQRGGTLIEDIISSEIEQAWRRDLKDVIEQARVEVAAAVKEQAATVLTEAIMRTVPR